MRKTGSMSLPLHPGKAPKWLFQRMVRLAGAVSEALWLEFGEKEFFRRLSDPHWFQAFGCVLAFDWHSSGLTTTTCGALKLALSQEEFGLAVAGGKGKTSRKAPEEILAAGEKLSLPGERIDFLKSASLLSAKVDSSCIQDAHALYHHCIFFGEKGGWCVVQQGMNAERRTARRYHWLGEGVSSFVQEPHSGIARETEEQKVLDLTSGKNQEIQKASVDLVKDNPLRLQKYFSGQTSLACEDFSMPARHEIIGMDISPKGWAELKRAYELQPENFQELVGIRGIGARKLRALALLSQLLFGIEIDWGDPAKYSFAHGGKDGIPFPVDKPSYDYSIQVLKSAVENAKVGEMEKMNALRRLGAFL